MNKLVVATAAVAATLITTAALAQPTPPTATATATANTGMPLPGPQAAAVAGDSDHDMMVGSFALGYMGRRTLPYGTGVADDAGNPPGGGVTEAPIIGARYWISPLLGIDAGVGFSLLDDGKVKVESPAGTVENDLAPVTGFLLHVGVPLALSNTGHFSFQVVPEANVGFASQTVEANLAGVPRTDKGTGFAFDIGARGGAEIHFGFIGVPQLSLQGSIGLLYRLERWKMESEVNGVSASVSETHGSFSTTVYDNPWNIFTSNVAALYYF